MSRAVRASSATGGSARYESAVNESVKETWPDSMLAAAKKLKLVSLEPGLESFALAQRWRRYHQMGVLEPNVIALNPETDTCFIDDFSKQA